MRLKADIEKKRSAVYRAKCQAKKAGDTELEAFYSGVFEALYWVCESRNSPIYSLTDTNNFVLPSQEKCLEQRKTEVPN